MSLSDSYKKDSYKQKMRIGGEKNFIAHVNVLRTSVSYDFRPGSKYKYHMGDNIHDTIDTTRQNLNWNR